MKSDKGTHVIKGVIFDIDGVVLDSMGIWKNLGSRYLKSIGIQPEEGLNEILFSMSMEEGAEYLKKHYNIDRSSSSIQEGISFMLESFYFEEVPAKKGAAELMQFFQSKGIRMTVASSSPRPHIEKALIRNGLMKYIDGIYTTGEIGISKHSPDIFDRAAKFMQLKPEEVLVLDDSLYALKTAKAAGYVTAGVYDKDGEPDQEGLRETGDIYIRELKELMASDVCAGFR